MKRLVSAILVSMVVIAAGPAAASTFLAMERPALVAEADAVVQGRVLKVDAFWEPTGTVIVSEAMVQVEDSLFGETPTVVIVRTFGGTVNGFTIEAHGFPVFAAGERVLLFLQEDLPGPPRPVQGGHGEDHMRVTGYQQGHYRVVADESGGEWAVPTTDSHASLLTADGKQAPAAREMPLAELKDLIRADAVRLGKSAD